MENLIEKFKRKISQDRKVNKKEEEEYKIIKWKTFIPKSACSSQKVWLESRIKIIIWLHFNNQKNFFIPYFIGYYFTIACAMKILIAVFEIRDLTRNNNKKNEMKWNHNKKNKVVRLKFTPSIVTHSDDKSEEKNRRNQHIDCDLKRNKLNWMHRYIIWWYIKYKKRKNPLLFSLQN